MLVMARMFQRDDIHWRYQINGKTTDLLLKGGGVFDITNDSFMLHPAQGVEWEHKHMNNNDNADTRNAKRSGNTCQ